MATKTITVDQDSLEYTPRDGLRTRSPVQLTVGSHNRVVIRRPHRVTAATAFGGFRSDSAFPNSTVVAILLGIAWAELLDDLRKDRPKRVVQVFGHAEPSGDEAHNKALSERRAEAVLALLTAEPEVLERIASEEDWSLEHHQFMLRALRCDPGPIDGLAGDLTTQAVRWFQQEYRDGLFHREGTPPQQPELAVTSKLDGPTTKALYEAFCHAVSPRLEPSELHPINPVVGCSEYNLASTDEVAAHRRVSLVVHDSVLPFAENAPCTHGDLSTCSLDSRGPKRCLWYRDHVLEPPASARGALHFDLRWLPLDNGNILLTALTTLSEDAPVVFQVLRTRAIQDAAEISEDVLDAELSAPLHGEVKLGVAQVVWEPPEDFDIHDFAAWQAKNRASSALEAWNAPAGATIPVFRVTGGDASALSPPPGADLDRLMCTQQPNEEGDTPTGLLAWDAFGQQYFVPLEGGRPARNLHALMDGMPRVVAFGYADADIDIETDPDEPPTKRGLL